MISIQGLSYRWCKVVAVAASLLTVGSAYGDDLTSARNALPIIREFANNICTRVSLEVEGRTAELSGEAKAGLNQVISKFVNLGIQGAGRYQHEASKGPLREELAEAIKNSDDGKLAVLDKLIDRLIPAGVSNDLGELDVPSPTPVPSDPVPFDISGRYHVEAKYNITATGEGGGVGAYIEALAGPRGTVRMLSTCPDVGLAGSSPRCRPPARSRAAASTQPNQPGELGQPDVRVLP
jgi:hypothetical protein